MKTIVKVEQYDSLNKRIGGALSVIDQMNIDELVERFLNADYNKQQKILNKLRK